MPLDAAAIWGKNIADAIAAIGIEAGTPVSSSQLEAVWTAVASEDRTQLTTKMTGAAPGVAHPPGAPMPIVMAPGSFT